MVEKKDVKVAVKAATQAVQPVEAKAEVKSTVPEKVEAEAEAAVLVKAEAAPVEREAKAAPAEKMITRKIVSKTAARKAAAPKGTVKKEAVPGTEAKKETTPKAAKKGTVKKIPIRKAAEPKVDVHFQFDGKDPVAKDMLDQAVKAFKKAHRGVEVKTIGLYIVANEGAIYYVVNGEGGNNYKIILQFDIKD